MNIRINYQDEGYYLSDDALLYDNAAMKAHYGDLIPSVRDAGTYCVFDTEIESDPLKDPLQMDLDLMPLAEIRTLADTLRITSGKLQAHQGNGRFPDPRHHSLLYRMSKDKTHIVILYGLERYGENGYVDAAIVAQWLKERSEKLTDKIKALEEAEKAEKEKHDRECAARIQNTKRMRKIVLIIGGLLLLGLLLVIASKYLGK